MKRKKAGEAYLPPEIITDILSRLEVKSLLVLKCVCKLWCSIIEDWHFVQMQKTRTKLTFVLKENLYDQDEDSKDYELLSLTDGLLLEKHQPTNKLRIRNPATKTMIGLPDPPRKPEVTRLMHLPDSDNYKVLSVFGKEEDGFGGCQVLTLYSLDHGLEWRNLEIPSLHHINGCQLDTSLFVRTSDVAYIMWFSDDDDDDDTDSFVDIVCIEMETESFETVGAPESLFASWEDVWPMDWDGKLSLSETVGQELHVWVLEDYKTQKWSDRKIIISLSFLSKHASISERFRPQFLRKGWLHFSANQTYRIRYDVESRREYIYDLPPGENISLIRMKFTLVNPYRVSQMR